MSWSELAAKAGVSDVSLRNFRKGRGNPNALSRRRIEAALGWKPGSIDAILSGGRPVAASNGEDADQLRHRIADLRDEIEHLELKYEENRPFIVAGIEREIAQLERQLRELDET